MITELADLIVWGSLVLTAIFVVAWASSPAWRRAIERPKHEFQDALRAYDERDHDRS